MNGYIKSIGQTQSTNNVQDDQADYYANIDVKFDDLLTNDPMTQCRMTNDSMINDPMTQ